MLEDLNIQLIDGDRGKNYPKQSEFQEKGHCLFLSAKNVTKTGFQFAEKVYISEDRHNRLRSGKLERNDIVLTTRGTIGNVAFYDDSIDDEVVRVNSGMLILRADSSIWNPRFLYFLFTSRIVQEQIASLTSGSAVPQLPAKDLKKFSLPRIPLEVQSYIVKVIGDLSDKLVINTQTNQTLEQMAQAIFKSWFVDFDPVKAKMNGEQPEGMDAVTASLFPEKLDSETGPPVGWSQGIIADIAKLNAKSWTKKKHPEEVHYVDLANTKNGVIETVTMYDFDEAPSRARRVLNSGDTIVGTVRPGNRSFAFIGETEQPLTGSTGFAVLSPKEEFWTSFVYLATTNDDSIDEYARLADGGAYPAIKPVVVADTPCVIPTTDIAQKFWQLTGAMLKKAHQNRLENEELAKLRDTLLPKLLLGEIDLDKVLDV